jgi:hypothetical protein
MGLLWAKKRGKSSVQTKSQAFKLRVVAHLMNPLPKLIYASSISSAVIDGNSLLLIAVVNTENVYFGRE